MQLNQKMMKSLAAIAVIMSVIIMETNGQEKAFGCCRSASIRNITVPITAYKLQRESLPCVRAVVFNTTEGWMCVHPNQNWVREKIKELIKLQGQKMNSTDSKPPPLKKTD